MTIERPRLLLIDSYDSFTFNLAALCRIAIPDCTIHIIENDRFNIDELLPYLKGFSAIIVGPGPGTPDLSEDIGVVRDLWHLAEDDVLPIFGVCLGFQSLVIENGGELKRLPVVKHGQVSQIVHSGIDVFTGVGKLKAVRYHSLYAELHSNKGIEPLAWADDVEENGVILMAGRHRTRPFWGVQYHPESVLTDGGGLTVLQNFWRQAEAWSKDRGRRLIALDFSAKKILGHPWPHIESSAVSSLPPATPPSVQTSVVELPGISVTDICELLGVDDHDSPFVLLDSAAEPGRFSIVGAVLPTSLQILYSVHDSFIILKRGKQVTREPLTDHDIWTWIASFMQRAEVKGGCPEVPFWGGLIGMLSYELGVHSLTVPLQRSTGDPNSSCDVNLLFVQRSLVFDIQTHKVYVQSTIPNDLAWAEELSHKLKDLQPDSRPLGIPSSSTQIKLPDRSRYISRIKDAQDSLRSGDSYELCLTARTRVSVPRCMSSWERYKLLRRTNPAPHSAYLRLRPTTFLSSSPERFLSYSRPPNSLCQLRPIKGTIRKAPGITRTHADEALRGSCKEVAENLMIVDLIRHDLHGVVGLDVDVKQFCGVEEYETVWQMVSVIEGRLPLGTARNDLGWEVLKRSLPPGSMTGAPKKRSVEILQNLEEEERGLYSGVFGYWCVGGGGDWSVAIRSCFKNEPEPKLNRDQQKEEWIIGAGGAITALSDPEAEWEEMLLKLQSVLGAFGASRPRS